MHILKDASQLMQRFHGNLCGEGNGCFFGVNDTNVISSDTEQANVFDRIKIFPVEKKVEAFNRLAMVSHRDCWLVSNQLRDKIG
jgi:hypothetical protein